MKPLSVVDLDYILEHTQEVWEELKQCRLFITGGTGFFGTWLLESFLWANQRLALNAEVVVLSRDPQNFAQKAPHLVEYDAIQFHQGDICHFDFPTGDFSHVIHAATEASAKLNAEDPLRMLEVILQGTRHTFDFAKHCGAKKILLTSSGAVYGKQPADVTHVPENYLGAPDIANPAAAYGVGKWTAEHMATLYHYQHQLDVKIARCFAFIGPHLPLDSHFAIGNFLRDAMAGQNIVVGGDGTPYRSYQYAADLTIWLWNILCRGETCRPYNVGSDEDYSIAEIAQHVAKSMDPAVAVEIKKAAEPGRIPERYVPAIERARQELKLSNGIALDEAIKRTLLWYQNN